MHTWITKHFHLSQLDNANRDVCLVIIQVMLLAAPICISCGIFYLYEHSILIGCIVSVEAIILVTSLAVWAGGFSRLARIIVYFGITMGTGVQNVYFPVDSGYEMIFPLMIAVSYIIFFHDERKLRWSASLFAVCVVILSLAARIRWQIPSSMTDAELRYARISTFISITVATTYIFRYFITNVERREAQLREAHRMADESRAKVMQSHRHTMLGEIAGGLAHEINNPLAIIIGAVFILQKHSRVTAGDGHWQKQIDQIDKMTRRISKITKGLLAFSGQSTSGNARVLFNLLEVVNDGAGFFRQQLQNSGIKFTIEAPNEPIDIHGMPHDITQVIVSLISNAYEAVQHLEQPWINIQITQNDSEAFIKVIDAGPGIAPDIAAKIMQPFFTTKEVGKGMGLDLTICRGICQDHQGRLEFDSSAPHTTFIVTLPRIQQSDQNTIKAEILLANYSER